MSNPNNPDSTPAERTITPLLLREWPLPDPGEDKYSRGSVLVIGGARPTPGAVLLAGTSALRAGAGHLTLAMAESVAPHAAVALPECGVVGLPENRGGSVLGSPEALQRLGSKLKHVDVVLVGPGLDDVDEARKLLLGLLAWERSDSGRQDPGPVWVLDAYALACLPELRSEFAQWAGRLVLTPNPREAGMLLGKEPQDLEAGIEAIADRFKAVVTCQGIIAAPPQAGLDGGVRSWRLGTGGGGLGTSGSGDVLAGATAGLCARGASVEQATCWASHLHASAADKLASRMGPLGFLARELADELPALLLEMKP